MLHPNFVIFGTILSLIGGLSYLKDTLQGKAKPNKVTWFLWALAPLIAFTAEITQGVGIQSLLTFIVGFNPLLIFLGSFVNKKAYWKITRLDMICGVFSLLGILLWYVTRIGNLAILFAILADGLAGIPTIIKAYKKPETENYLLFLLSGINAALTLLTISTWDIAHFAFPLYIFLICLLLFVLVRFQLGKKLSS